jgi:hypothetical protein
MEKGRFVPHTACDNFSASHNTPLPRAPRCSTTPSNSLLHRRCQEFPAAAYRWRPAAPGIPGHSVPTPGPPAAMPGTTRCAAGTPGSFPMRPLVHYSTTLTSPAMIGRHRSPGRCMGEHNLQHYQFNPFSPAVPPPHHIQAQIGENQPLPGENSPSAPINRAPLQRLTCR